MLDQLVEEWRRRHVATPAANDAGGGAAHAASQPYIGRFAPSPTGPLHAGSLVAALASWLDARAHGGRWLLRIDDLDVPRTAPGADRQITDALRAYGLIWDGDVVYQSTQHGAYRAAFEQLRDAGRIYACGCTRREIADSLTPEPVPPGASLSPEAASGIVATMRGREKIYPGTCRAGLAKGRAARAWRVRVDDASVRFHDHTCGPVAQDLARDTGDFVLLRADGQWAYQLAVVVDDAAAGVTDVVRGADLLASTPRQIYLQQALRLPTPAYRHVPVVTAADGEKLSKQNGAEALPLDARGVAAALERAARHLHLFD